MQRVVLSKNKPMYYNTSGPRNHESSRETREIAPDTWALSLVNPRKCPRNTAVYILKTTVYTLKAYTIKTMKHDPCIIRSSIVIDKLYFDRKQKW